MHFRIILTLFGEKKKCSGIAFFLQSSRYDSKEQPCLRRTGPQGDLLLLFSWFHFFYFIFSAPISFSFCFQISPSLLLFFLCPFLKLLSSIVEQFSYTYIYIVFVGYIYISLLENLWIFS